MKNALIKLVSLMVLSVAILTSLILSVVIEERCEKIKEEKKEEERMEQQIMLNESYNYQQRIEETEVVYETEKEIEEKIELSEEEKQRYYEDKKEEIMSVYRYYMYFKCGRRYRGHAMNNFERNENGDEQEFAVKCVCVSYLNDMELPLELEDMRDELISIMDENYLIKIDYSKQYKYFVLPKDSLEARKIYQENYTDEKYEEIFSGIEAFKNTCNIFIPTKIY